MTVSLSSETTLVIVSGKTDVHGCSTLFKLWRL